MKTTMKRRGRPRKIRKPDNSPGTESNNPVDRCKWKATVNQSGLKIILHKVDEVKSALMSQQSEEFTMSNQSVKLLLPKLSLPRIDSLIPVSERNFSVFTIDKEEDGFQQFYSSYSSSMISRPEVQQIFASQRIVSMNSLLHNSYISRRSRKILKDVKNTASNGDMRRNGSIQPALYGQENVPLASVYDTTLSVHPQVCVRLTQLNASHFRHNLIEKYAEASSTYNSLQDNFESSFQSITVGDIHSEGLERNSSEMIVKNLTQSKNEMEVPAESKLYEAGSKRGRKRKYYKKEVVRVGPHKKPKRMRTCRLNTRSSSTVSTTKAANDYVGPFYQSSLINKDQCKMNPSLDILQKTFDRRIENGKNGDSKIIHKETALQFHSASFENQEKAVSDFLESPNRLQQTEVRLNISSMKTVHKNNTQLVDEFLQFRYSSIDKLETSEKQSFNYIQKRRWEKKDSSFECNASKKRPLDDVSSSREAPSSNGMNRCAIHIKRSNKSNQSPTAVNFRKKSQGPVHKTNSTSSFSYTTRNKISKNKESVQFYQLPWKTAKGYEILKERPISDDDIFRREKRREILEETPISNGDIFGRQKRYVILKKTQVKSELEENCNQANPEVKLVKRKKKKSIKTESVNSYSCCQTRLRTTQSSESVEFFQLPWKQTKGFEVVKNKSKNVDTQSEILKNKSKVNTQNDSMKNESKKLRTQTAVGMNKLKKIAANKWETIDVIEIQSDFSDEHSFKGWSKDTEGTVNTDNAKETADASLIIKGILKHNEMLASSTPFPESSRRKATLPNVSFIGCDNNQVDVDAANCEKKHRGTNTAVDNFNGPPLKSLSVLVTRAQMPNHVSCSPSRNRRRMTKREALQRAETFNSSKKALEIHAKSDQTRSDSKSVKMHQILKRSTRLQAKRVNCRYSPTISLSSLSSEEEPEILVDRNKQNTPCVRLNKLSSADITSYKITPLKEERIPKKSKTEDDYGIDDINTDDSTDDEEFPKKNIPRWAKEYKNQPRCQSYLNPSMIYEWMKPPKFQYSLRHVFFSMQSRKFM